MIARWEIVCVDDASSDGTSASLERLAATISGLRVVRHSRNLGIFRSFADGFAVAKGTLVYATGADGQWPATNLQPMVARVVAGADLVVGVRLNRKQVYNLKRRFVSLAFNLSTRLLFGVKTQDAGSIELGARDIFRLDLISRSPFVEAERIIKGQQCGYRVDVEFRVRGGGKETGAQWSNVVASTRDCPRVRAVLRGQKQAPHRAAGGYAIQKLVDRGSFWRAF